MRRALLLLTVTIIALTTSASPQKRTLLYAVKGTDSLYLDHYVAPVEGVRPCMIFVFGGGFSSGTRDKKGDIPYYEFFTSQGYDVIAIDYRLGMKNVSAPSIIDFFKLFENTINMAVEDLFSATQFTLTHAHEWNIDPGKIVISGSSAGAITVLQAEHAICNQKDICEILPEGFNYAGVISFAGAIFSIDGAPVWPRKPAPILLFHGSSDNQVPYNKMALFGIGLYGSKYIAKKLRQEDYPYWFYSVEYENHSMAGKPMHDNHGEIITFLNDFVKQGKSLMIDTNIIDNSLPKRKTFFLPTDYIKSNY